MGKKQSNPSPPKGIKRPVPPLLPPLPPALKLIICVILCLLCGCSTENYSCENKENDSMVIIRDGVIRHAVDNVVQLDTGACAIDGAYNSFMISILSGIGTGQTREIVGYYGNKRVVYVNYDWIFDPEPASEYIIWTRHRSGDLEFQDIDRSDSTSIGFKVVDDFKLDSTFEY